MDKKQIVNLKSRFDAIAHFDKAEGIEFWYARELQPELGYTEWRNFTKVIEKAKISCETAKQVASNHFVDINKMVSIGSDTTREIADMKLTRYACYLIGQNMVTRAKTKLLLPKATLLYRQGNRSFWKTA